MVGDSYLIGIEVLVDVQVSGVFLLFDSVIFVFQFLWLVIMFGVFYWIIKNVVVLWIVGILEDCKDCIVGDFGEVNCFKEEIDVVIVVYEQVLVEVCIKVYGIVSDMCVKLEVDQEICCEKVEVDLVEKLIVVEVYIVGIKIEVLFQIGDIVGDIIFVFVEQLMGKVLIKIDLIKVLKLVMD